MAILAKKPITAKEFLLMPDPADGTKQELVRGEIVTMPPPRGLHGICCAKVVRRIGNLSGEDVLAGFSCRVSDVLP